MKKIYTLFLFLIPFLGFAQNLITENCDAPIAPALPAGWTTSTIAGIGWRTDSTNFSTGYTGASGLKNIVIRNTDSTGTYMLYSPVINAQDYTSLTVLWGSRVSNNFLNSGSTTPVLEASADGGSTWTNVSYAENSANSTWSLVNGGTAISLPASLDHATSVQLRWSISIINAASGTYRIDDVVVAGTYSPLTQVTFQVNMFATPTSGAYIALSQNGGFPTVLPMTNSGMGIFQYTGLFAPGTQLNYGFLSGPSATTAEIVPAACGIDINGIYTRGYTVTASDETLSPVCFGSCSNCNIQQVVLRVNMSQQTIDPSGVFVSGNFPGGVSSPVSMSDIGGGVYQATVSINEGYTLNYRFSNGSASSGLETVPSSCGTSVSGNLVRQITGTASNQTLDPVCFGECANCVVVTPTTINVTLQVNMSQQTISPNGVHVAGTFQGWNPGTTAMTDAGGGIYTYTFQATEGDVIQFKFINGNTWGDAEFVPSACGQADDSGNINRVIFAGNVDYTYGPVCYNECADCVVQPETVPVTFYLGFSAPQVGSSDGVHLAGSFNNWSPTATMLNLVNGTDYQVTVDLPVGTTIQYKYINGNTFTQAETVPSACGVDDGFGGYNRSYTVPAVAGSVDTVCFAQCIPCIVSVSELTTDVLSLWPNPAVDALNIQSPEWMIGSSWVVSDMQGRTIRSGRISSMKMIIVTNDLVPGIYLFRTNGGKALRFVKN
jgi:hypothetical protein